MGRPAKQLPAGVPLGIIRLGQSGANRTRFVLASRAARAGSCERSKLATWSEATLARLEAWLSTARRKRGQTLDSMLNFASKVFCYTSTCAETKQRMIRGRQLGRGRWHGKLDLDGLMSSPGFVVVRGVVDPIDCATLVDAAEAHYGAAGLRTSAKRLHTQRSLGRLAGERVHHLLAGGRATLQKTTRAEVGKRNEAADVAWNNAVREVAHCAGHFEEQSSDEAVNLCVHGMARGKWHTDSTASLAYVVALTTADATEFVQVDERWPDVAACGAARRKSFFQKAWAEAPTATVKSAEPQLQPGDVVYFYTKRIHRAPPPPSMGKPRYTLFGAFCREGKSEWAPPTSYKTEMQWGRDMYSD